MTEFNRVTERTSKSTSTPGERRATREETHPTNAFTARIDRETIRSTLSLVHTLFEECHLFVEDDGIRLSAIDAATVAWADLRVDRAAFETFEATPTHVGVDLERLSDVVRMADRGDLIEFALESESRRLHVRIGDLEYTLALVDPSVLRSPPEGSSSEFSLPGTVGIPAGEFARAVRAAEMVGDHLTLGIDDDDDVFYVEADGDTDDVSLELAEEALLEFTPEEVHSIFSVSYLAAISRAMPADPDLTVQLGSEQPLSIQYEFAQETGEIEYLLAPRIATT